jgi:hypothetical protein|tara:strand:- start:283 stop:468 length:186 start_codon:yes stop_codon:yes gene_type:complete
VQIFLAKQLQLSADAGRKIPIVRAGQSLKGVDFVSQNAHQNFVMAHPEKLKTSVIVSSRRA